MVKVYLVILLIQGDSVYTGQMGSFSTYDACMEKRAELISEMGPPRLNNYELTCITDMSKVIKV